MRIWWLAVLVCSASIAHAQTNYFIFDGESGVLEPPWEDCDPPPNATNSSARAHTGSRSFRGDVPDPPSGRRSAKCIVFTQARQTIAYYSAWYFIEFGNTSTNSTYNNMQWKTNNALPTTVPGGVKSIVSFNPDGQGNILTRLDVVDCNVTTAQLHAMGNPSASFLDPAGVGTGTCKLRQNVGSPIRTVPTGTWFHLEVYLKQTETNGHMTVWQDGVQLYDVTHPNFNALTAFNPNWVPPSQSDNEFLYWGIGNYGDANRPPSRHYMDDAYIADYKTWDALWSGNPAPQISLSAVPENIVAGDSSTLTWSSTNATSCTASGGWSGSKALSGSESVSPTVTTQYTLSCTGTGGTNQVTVTVTVAATRPNFTVYRAPTPPVIDCALKEYAFPPQISITNGFQTSGDYWFLWDDDAFYIAARVDDTNMSSTRAGRDEQLWRDDSIETLWDTLRNRGGSLQADDFKFFVNLLNTQRDEGNSQGDAYDAVWQSSVCYNGTLDDSSDLDETYFIEIRLPWAAFLVSAPTAGTQWGFDLSLNDNRPDTVNGTDDEYGQTFVCATASRPNVPDSWCDITYSATEQQPFNEQSIRSGTIRALQ